MRIKKFTKELLASSKYSLKRFPISLTTSLLLFIFLIVLNEGLIEDGTFVVRLSMITGLALVLSIFIHLINETYLKSNRSRLISFIIGGLFLSFYYLVFLNELKTTDYARYVGMIIFFILGSTYIQRLRNKGNFEKYIISILNGIFITGIYSMVLYLGMAFIILTIEQLFNLNIISYIYYYVFLAVIFIFGVSMFLSKYPREDFKDLDYPKAFKVLLLYIVIPLISVYSLILYAYFIKIILTWQWPSGLVSHLVIWYSSISVFVIFFILPLLEYEKNRLALYFRSYFPFANIPILFMMFLSIGQRINQYGFTENRYYILLLGIWILLIMLHFIFRRPKNSTFILISLSLFILLSILGPLSSFNVSIRSQNNRLNGLLTRYNILQDGELNPNNAVPAKDQQEISNILSYFESNHDLAKVDYLPEGYNLNNMVSDFGFPFSPGYEADSYPFYYSHDWAQVIDITNYDYYFIVNSWNNRSHKVSDLYINYDRNRARLSISKGNDDFTINIKDYVKFIHEKIKYKSNYDLEDMTISIESDYRLKLIFNNITASESSTSNDIDLYDVEIIVLLDYEN